MEPQLYLTMVGFIFHWTENTDAVSQKLLSHLSVGQQEAVTSSTELEHSHALVYSKQTASPTQPFSIITMGWRHQLEQLLISYV